MRYQYPKPKLIKCKNCGKEFSVRSIRRKVCPDCKSKRKTEYNLIHKDHAKTLRTARKKKKSN